MPSHLPSISTLLRQPSRLLHRPLPHRRYAARKPQLSVIPAPTASGSLPEKRSDDPVFVAVLPALREGDGPPSERRPNRQLPSVPRPWVIWAKTLPIFLAIIVGSALVLFNYERQSSSVVTSTLYALRTSELARNELGDEIYFRDKFPWIWGKMDQLHGKINIQFGVKGTRGRGVVKFHCVRPQRMGYVSRHDSGDLLSAVCGLFTVLDCSLMLTFPANSLRR